MSGGVAPGAHLRAALVASVALAQGGCFLWTSREQGQTLERDVQHLSDRVDMLDDQLDEERERLDEMIGRARAEVEKLEATLKRATRVLARNSADFGAEMESAKARLREVDGALAELRHELELLDGRVDESSRKLREFALAAGLDLPVDEDQVPDKPGEHFDAIKAARAAGRAGEVRALGKVFLDRYEDGARADDVQLLIAHSYLDQKRYAKALGALRRFADLYPKSEHTPEVLYEMANAFFALGDCTDARILVDAITSRHAKSPFAEKARKLGERMRTEKSKCTS